MRATTVFEKLLTSTINTIFVLLLFIPFNYYITDSFTKKAILIGLFFLSNFIFLMSKQKRMFGMIILHSRFDRQLNTKQCLIYCSLYSCSFSSLLFWVYFPFDIFLFNMLLIQLPTVRITKTTLHGLLSAQLTSVKTQQTEEEQTSVLSLQD